MTSITHINPPELYTSPAFSQGTHWPQGRLLFVGGQNGTDASGQITGDIATQSAQAPRNVRSATAEVWGDHPAAVTVLRVAGLGRPEALVEIDAIAMVPDQT